MIPAGESGKIIVPDHLATPIEVRVASLERQVAHNKKRVQFALSEFKKALNDMELIVNQLTFEQTSRQRQDSVKK